MKLRITINHGWGTAPAPGALRRAPRRSLHTADGQIDLVGHTANVNAGGVVDCARGGRAPRAFSLIELMVVMALLSLIVLALMAVFSSTQRAFRASVTQTDVLEGSRAAVDLITTDLRGLTPSDGMTNYYDNAGILHPGAVNFCALDNSYASCSCSGGTLLYQPLQQSLPGTGAQRANVLNYFFVLGRNNVNGRDRWTGTGYVVNATNTSPLYPLYRFYAETNIAMPPYSLYAAFINAVNQSQWTNMSHVLDGVVHLTVRPFDASGYWMTNNYQWHGSRWITNQNVAFTLPWWGEVGCHHVQQRGACHRRAADWRGGRPGAGPRRLFWQHSGGSPTISPASPARCISSASA